MNMLWDSIPYTEIIRVVTKRERQRERERERERDGGWVGGKEGGREAEIFHLSLFPPGIHTLSLPRGVLHEVIRTLHLLSSMLKQPDHVQYTTGREQVVIYKIYGHI